MLRIDDTTGHVSTTRALTRSPALYPAEAHAAAGPELRGGGDVRGGDDRYHRVAAGHRVVGEEEDRAAARRDLKRAIDHPLGRELVGGAALQRRSVQPDADPVGVRGHLPGGAEQ